MKFPQKEMTTVPVGAEPRSGNPETSFNVISLPDPQSKSKEYFYTVDAETLLITTLPPIRFVVGELLPQGLHILAGSSKIGKSWLVLWWCLQIARGEPVWTFSTEKGTVLYLCLEDSFSRIQDRLFDFTSEAPSNLHYATMANTLGEGLETQIENFIRQHDNTKLIVIDTLQYIRPASKDANAYANDYRDISFEQQGSFGQSVEIAAKVDLSGMDAKNLCFYSYDKATNTYVQITNPQYWIDENGYLRFTTELAGDIVISDGPLERK